ncbi:hypothetical protein JJV70_10855 [Streptomyces sp. JJ66]|uniref:hypothetical protein n=1 Tax=Streptomyces sp. JJ66 TaxID=2803843 RepID=UPI001C55BE47|nr:hypothetical protein [Streptomyces sp. JJ66]MBW1602595.1 hypothetical protein [Streptomyces sp. JJ66]
MRAKAIRRAAGAAGALALAAGLSGATVAPAQAAPSGCPYPYVCFYDGPYVLGKYKDVTSYYQSVSRSAKATTVYNTRNDDVAYIRLSNGNVACVGPKQRLALNPFNIRVTGIKISWSATC